MNKKHEFEFQNRSTKVEGMKLGGYMWFDWTVFCSSPKEKLDLIEKVEYHLHPSFPEPIRVVTDKTNGFALNGRGWGEFLIKIIVYLKEEPEVTTEHKLKL